MRLRLFKKKEKEDDKSSDSGVGLGCLLAFFLFACALGRK